MKNPKKSNGLNGGKSNSEIYAAYWRDAYAKMVKLNNTHDLPAKARLEEELFKSFMVTFYRLLYKSYGKYAHIEYRELLHEGVARIFEKFYLFKPTENPNGFYGWASRVVENKILDLVNAKYHKTYIPVSRLKIKNAEDAEPKEVEAYYFNDQTADLGQEFEKADTLERIILMVQSGTRFGEEEITLFNEVMLKGLSYEEFSEQYGVKMGTLRVNVNRLRSKIRNYMAA